jgi:glycosyltransferase involved in cell wall biosynthesis
VAQNEERRGLRVCYFGTYRADYSRNQVMIEGLRRSGVEVVECHERLWQGIEDRVQVASGGWLRPAFALRVARTYGRLLARHRQIGDYDVMVLGYPGQVDVYLARILTWLRRRPLVLDVFMSLYLIAWERGLTARHPLTAKLIYWLDKTACLLPDLLILDTAAYVRWFEEHQGLDPARFRLVPTGADDRVFGPVEDEKSGDGVFRLLYYGTFIPNHGVEQIVEAARIMQGDPTIRFELIGEGPTKAEAMALAEEYGLENLWFSGWVPKEALPARVAKADACLGAFGVTPQSVMTVQNKIYEALAMGKPLITGDSPTMRAAFVDGEHLLLCRRQDPQSLADAIVRLRGDADLQVRLAKRGRARYVGGFTTAAIGKLACQHLQGVAERSE